MDAAALPGLVELRAELDREVRRVADRLRTLSAARLAETVEGAGSRADLARRAAQALADAAADLAGERRRALPVLSDLAAGDQIAVTGTDLLVAVTTTHPGQVVGTLAGRRTAEELVAGALEQLRATRRAL